MESIERVGRSLPGSLAALLLGLLACAPLGTDAAAQGAVRIVAITGQVEVSPAGASAWVITQTNQTISVGDQLRTGTNSLVSLWWPDRSMITFGALAHLEVLPPTDPSARPGLHLLRGLLSFFHRDEPGRIRVLTRGASAGVEGTEFVVDAPVDDPTAAARLSLIDGRVRLTNSFGSLVLTNGQQAELEPGRGPSLVPSGFIVSHVIQWALFYPAILDLSELPEEDGLSTAFAVSLQHYRRGNVPAALATHPGTRSAESDAGRIFHAALLLAVGQVEAAMGLSERVRLKQPEGDRLHRLAVSLQAQAAAVLRRPAPTIKDPALGTEWLAMSYLAQSEGRKGESMERALDYARKATGVSKNSGFAWARLAELEFGFGRSREARQSVDRSLALMPDNAQAVALDGFLHAAENDIADAELRFQRAIELDNRLANGWLGRGLCRIRLGRLDEGRDDLLIASALEPQRSMLRSYLGRALAEGGLRAEALHELGRARQTDPSDPTPWLYSALVRQQQNRLNQAMRELETSSRLSDNRSLVRSRALLGEDRVEHSVNLARIYDEAGLNELAIRDAGLATAADHASYNARLFLSDAYGRARRGLPFEQRLESVMFSEHLLASLLGPPNGRALSSRVSQQEYSRLLAPDRLGVASSTEYRSYGMWSQWAAQHGTLGNTAYVLEGMYELDPGQMPNARAEMCTLSARVKQMLSPRDGLLLQVYGTRWDSLDAARRYDPALTVEGRWLREDQGPNLLAGYHREWSPESHTLLLFSRFEDDLVYRDPSSAGWLLGDAGGAPNSVFPTTFDRSFVRQYQATALEVQQILKLRLHTWVVGVRAHSNVERTRVETTASPRNGIPDARDVYLDFVPYVLPDESLRLPNTRIAAYIQDSWQLTDSLQLHGGVTVDHLHTARNSLAAPISPARDAVWRASPKAGLLWEINQGNLLKLAYARSVTGQDLDQSVRLEPAHYAGLVGSYRTALPDSLSAGFPGERIESIQAAYRARLHSSLFATLTLQRLESHREGTVGAYHADLLVGGMPGVTQLGESSRFREENLNLAIQQLLGDGWAVGARYGVARSRLTQSLHGLDPAYCANGDCGSLREGLLQNWGLDASLTHPSGFFARWAGTAWLQSGLRDTEMTLALPSEQFWQVDSLLGYRSPRRQFEVSLGLLNLLDHRFQIHPINVHARLPRGRTLSLIVRVSL